MNEDLTTQSKCAQVRRVKYTGRTAIANGGVFAKSSAQSGNLLSQMFQVLRTANSALRVEEIRKRIHRVQRESLALVGQERNVDLLQRLDVTRGRTLRQVVEQLVRTRFGEEHVGRLVLHSRVPVEVLLQQLH